MTRAPQAESWGIHEEAVHISLHSIRLVLLGGGKDQVCLLIDGLQKLPLMPLFSFWVPAKGEDSFLLEATVWGLRHSYILWRDCDGLISAKIWNSNLKCPEPKTCVAKGRAQLPLKAAPRHCGAQNLLPFSPIRLTAQSSEDEGPLAQEPVICGPHPSLCAWQAFSRLASPCWGFCCVGRSAAFRLCGNTAATNSGASQV